MIKDLLHDTSEPNAIADICIVGAGAAGIVLAVDLVRRGKNVILLEAGGPGIEEPSQEPYRSEIVGLPTMAFTPAAFVPREARPPNGAARSSSSIPSTLSRAPA